MKMTIRELKKILNEIPTDHDDAPIFISSNNEDHWGFIHETFKSDRIDGLILEVRFDNKLE